METMLEREVRAAGLRVTPGRISVLTALASAPHSDALSLSMALPEVSVQSVHNVLADLSSAGIIRRIEPAGSAALFERRTGDNHHHLVCTGCNSVCDVDCVHGSAPCLTPSDTSGFVVATAEIIFWGLCPDCQQCEQENQEKAS